jgi:hypothetical protein
VAVQQQQRWAIAADERVNPHALIDLGPLVAQVEEQGGVVVRQHGVRGWRWQARP